MKLAEAYFDERAAHLFPTSPMARMRRVCAADCETDDELVARLRESEALVTQLAAIQARDLAELRRRRVAQQGDAGLRGPEADEHGWLTQELGVALGLSDRQAHERIDQAQALLRYESLAVAMGMGAVQSWTAQRLVTHLDELAQYVSTEQLQAAERTTVAWLLSGPATVTALNARMRRLIIRARAAAGDTDDDEVARRHARRRVSVTCEGDGTASLFARLAEADGLALARALDERARQPVAEGDERTLAQRQADHLVASVTGAPAVHGLPLDVPDHAASGARAGVGVRLSVTVPLQSLVAGTEPATVPGVGTIPAATARQLAGAHDVQARPIVYDATSGRLLGIGQYMPATAWWSQGSSRITWAPAITPVRGYEHPALMDEFIRTRDAVCRAPGCRRRADRCDCDHIDPYPQGQTSVENSCCLCRRHHRLKTHALGWGVDVSPGSTLTWTTPTGLTASTEPRDLRTEQERDVPPF